MSLLKCENLSFAYDGVTVVRDLNFTVEEGDYLCIIGENGAGKSTLIKGLLRLKKPSAGKVELGEGLRATEIGYLPQQTQIQKDFPASVREVVLSGCLNRMGLRPFYTRAEKERARENMEALEILELQDQCYRDLSGGQQQRVLLARAMCAAQKLILLDEPVSGLDPVATRSLYAQIARINETAGLTVIMVSHDIDASLKYASHILHLGQEGQLFFGTQKEYRRTGGAPRRSGADRDREPRKGAFRKEILPAPEKRTFCRSGKSKSGFGPGCQPGDSERGPEYRSG